MCQSILSLSVCVFQAKGQFKKQSVANNVEIRVPVPSDADSPKFKTSTGHAKYVPEKNWVVWSIKSFPVRNQLLMSSSSVIRCCFMKTIVIYLLQTLIHFKIFIESVKLSSCLCVHWQGGKEFLMRAHFGLPSVENDEKEGKPPITVKFEIPYFTVSGIQVCT